MESKENPYKLDRTAFQAMTVQEANDYQRDYRNHTVKERLEIALYLTSIAYNFDMNHPPKMDKTIFTKRKQGDITDQDDIDQLTKK
jgi:hypothetical protein